LESRPTAVPLPESGGEVHLFARADRPLDEAFVPLLAELSDLLIASHEERSEHFARELQRAKLASLAEFAAGAGHEINNPLATIRGRVQMLLRDEADPERRQALATIGGQALRIRDMIGDTMLFARPPEPRPEPLDLVEAIGVALRSLQEQADARNSRFEVHAEGPVPILADRTQLSVVISSLIQNSLDALPDGGPIRITARSVAERDRQFALLDVADDGPGLSKTDREHLFDPFYSGRQAGRGLGFGLSKCWRIVTMHGGRIEVESTLQAETRFRVYWPQDEPVSPVVETDGVCGDREWSTEQMDVLAWEAARRLDEADEIR
jgi:signal transduction histidine kinase